MAISEGFQSAMPIHHAGDCLTHSHEFVHL